MYRTILVPLDGSTRAERILPYIEELATNREATIVFLQVIESVALMAGPYDTTLYYDKEASDRLIETARAYLDGLVLTMREKGIAAKSVLEFGPTVKSILDVAERENAELIAMASHGRTGLARAFYGSVAAGVMHQADRPILLIRAADRQS